MGFSPAFGESVSERRFFVSFGSSIGEEADDGNRHRHGDAGMIQHSRCRKRPGNDEGRLSPAYTVLRVSSRCAEGLSYGKWRKKAASKHSRARLRSELRKCTSHHFSAESALCRCVKVQCWQSDRSGRFLKFLFTVSLNRSIQKSG